MFSNLLREDSIWYILSPFCVFMISKSSYLLSFLFNINDISFGFCSNFTFHVKLASNSNNCSKLIFRSMTKENAYLFQLFIFFDTGR